MLIIRDARFSEARSDSDKPQGPSKKNRILKGAGVGLGIGTVTGGLAGYGLKQLAIKALERKAMKNPFDFESAIAAHMLENSRKVEMLGATGGGLVGAGIGAGVGAYRASKDKKRGLNRKG